MKATETQHSSRRLTKHPPQKLPPPPSQTTSSSSPLPSPRRMPSFSKRHASFDSPREVPLPSPSQNDPNISQFSYFQNIPKSEPNVLTKQRPTSLSQAVERVFTPVFEDQIDEPEWTAVSKRRPSSEIPSQVSKNPPAVSPIPPPPPPTAAGPSQIHPYPRPYSVPHAQSDHGRPRSSSPQKYNSSTTTVDRASSASLPLPTQIPFHVLPKANVQAKVKPVSSFGQALADIAQLSEEEQEPQQTSTSRAASDDGTDSSGSLPAASSSNPSCDSSGRGSPVDDVRSESLRKEFARPVSHPIPQLTPFPHLREPPLYSQQMSLPLSPPETSLAAATALRRSATVSSHHKSVFPPPEPPVILPSPPLPPPVSLSATLQSCPPSSSSSSSTRDSPGNSDATTSTDLTSPSSSDASQNPRPNTRLPSLTDPPYAPFLSHSPPPADSWIEVETTPTAYRMNVRLPGFQRDGITLATKKRRILHVVADSWGTGGGHFERRISFGYDADLSQVRAEFDGDMLRVVVPRRVQPTILDQGMGYAI